MSYEKSEEVPQSAWAGCLGKRPYPSATQAWSAVTYLRRRGKVVSPYKCNICHRWHLAGRQLT